MILNLRTVLGVLCLSVATVAGAATTTEIKPSLQLSTDFAANTASDTDTEVAPATWASNMQEILMSALSLTGVRYKFGGTSPDTGFDCSGFVRYVFSQAANLNLPHGARAISQIGQSVALSDLKPGDLVFYNTLRSTFSHVGIYIGNNRFIHAPSTGGGVHIADMSESYWAKRFNGARRIQPYATNAEINPPH
jgi:cell wall-associated NlpC family hydrolase